MSKIAATLQTMKNIQSKTKAIKTGKELGTTYCFGGKGFMHNFSPQEVKMTNTVLREKSNCVVSQSNKSIFLKQKQNNNKIILRFTNRRYKIT